MKTERVSKPGARWLRWPSRAGTEKTTSRLQEMLSTNVPVNVLCIILNPNNAKAEMTDHGTHIFSLCFGKAKEGNNSHEVFFQQRVLLLCMRPISNPSFLLLSH